MILLQIVMVSPVTHFLKKKMVSLIPESLSPSSKSNESLSLLEPHSESEERLQNSVLQFTEIKIYPFCCKAQQMLKEIRAV